MQILSKIFKIRKIKLLKTNSLKQTTKQYFFQTMEQVSCHLKMDKYQKLTKTLGNLKKITLKNCRFYPKNAKIRDIKKLKTNPLLPETIQCPIIKP